MVEREYTFGDLRPERSGFEVEFLDDECQPISGAEFTASVDRGDNKALKSDGSGRIDIKAGPSSSVVKVTLDNIGAKFKDRESPGAGGGEAPDPKQLPAKDLCNPHKPNPINGKGPLGNMFKEESFFYKESNREDLVITLQKMLNQFAPQYDVPSIGIDGKFGNGTEAAVLKFQEKCKDWECNDLKRDGLVGPRTSDALNRKMVGEWYDYYQTPSAFDKDKLFYTVTMDRAANGISINLEKAKKARVTIVKISNKRKFILGVNLAWLDGEYDHDFGRNSLMNIRQPYFNKNEAQTNIEEYFSHMEEMGIAVVRIWAFERFEGLEFDGNGRVTGCDGDLIRNLRDVCKMAGDHGMKAYVCLLDTWALWSNDKSPNEKKKLADTLTGIIKSDDKLKSYIDNAIRPLLNGIGSKNIFAVDVLNEPEGILDDELTADGNGDWKAYTYRDGQGKPRTGYSDLRWDQGLVQNFIGKCAAAIHDGYGGEIKVSCGLKKPKNLDTLYRSEAGKDEKEKLDFYDIHVYNNTGALEKYDNNKYKKPCIVGECGQDTEKDPNTGKWAGKWDDGLQERVVESFIKNALDSGYSGCLAWNYNYKFIKRVSDPRYLNEPDPARMETMLKNDNYLSLIDATGNPRPACTRIKELSKKVIKTKTI